MSAFKSAFEMPHVFAAECDIQITRDKQLVVSHDATVDRLSNGSGWVKDFTYAKLLELDLPQGEKYPRLLDVVHLAKEYNKKLLIEIKGEGLPNIRETTAELIDFIEENNLHTEIMVVSFWVEPLRVIKSAYPQTLTSLILTNGFDPDELITLCEEAKANGISTEHYFLSQDLMQMAAEKEMFVNTWVINDMPTYERVKELGVDYITTNNPEKFLTDF